MLNAFQTWLNKPTYDLAWWEEILHLWLQGGAMILVVFILGLPFWAFLYGMFWLSGL